MQNRKIYICSAILLFSFFLQAQDFEIEKDLVSSKDIYLGQLGAFEGSIFGLDRLNGKNDLRFQIEGLANDVVFISNVGQVGIGTNSPSYFIDVNSANSSATAKFSSTSTISTDLLLENLAPGGITWSLRAASGTSGFGGGAFELFSGLSGATHMVVTTDGKIGIGPGLAVLPNDALDVTGDIDASGCVQTGDTGTIGGTCISDKRYKKNIYSLENQLSNVLALRPVSFDWKENINNGVTGDIGLIAQEVEELIPEMVITDEDGYKKVRYDISLQMRVIKAIQEQQELIKTQEENISSQQAEIDLLKKEMSFLKAMVANK